MISLYNMGRKKNQPIQVYNVTYSSDRRRRNWQVRNFQQVFSVDPNEQWTRVEGDGKIQTTWQYQIQIVEPFTGVNRRIGRFLCKLSKQDVATDVTYAVVKSVPGYPPRPIIVAWGENRETYARQFLWATGNMRREGPTRVVAGTQEGTLHYWETLHPGDSFWIIFASTSEPHGLQIKATVWYTIEFAV